MSKADKKQDFVWVIVETLGQEENFLGLNDTESGETFIPVTAEREQGLMLLGRLPGAVPGATRQVESIHQRRILEAAGAEGFAVYLVDEEGRFQKRLDAVKAN